MLGGADLRDLRDPVLQKFAALLGEQQLPLAGANDAARARQDPIMLVREGAITSPIPAHSQASASTAVAVNWAVVRATGTVDQPGHALRPGAPPRIVHNCREAPNLAAPRGR